jgi:hypothetical protein
VVANILFPPSVDDIIAKFSRRLGVTKLNEWATKLKLNFTTTNSSSVTLLAPTDDAITSAQTKLGFPFDFQFWSEHQRQLLLNHAVITESPLLYSQIVSSSNRTMSLQTSSIGGSIAIQPASSAVGGTPIRLGPFDALVYSADHIATDGVVHTVTQMIPPVSMNKTMYEWIRDHPNYTIFTTLIETAGLVGMLTDVPVYGQTLIVPSDDAFQRYADVVDFLKKPENGRYLRAVLQNHVFFYNLYSETVTSGTTLLSYLKTTGFVFTDKYSGALVINGVGFRPEDAVYAKK